MPELAMTEIGGSGVDGGDCHPKIEIQTHLGTPIMVAKRMVAKRIEPIVGTMTRV